MNDITAVILTKNEEVNIERCIQSIQDIVDRIVVVDSGSTDNTVEIAKSLGADIYYHQFEHYAAQFNWALNNTNINTVWVYRIDVDEAVTPELKNEILEECKKHRDDYVNAFLMKHKLYFLGRYLKHGGTYPFLKITIFKPQYADFENRAMGEHVVLKQGKCIELKNDCLHYDCKNLTAFIDKHNAYATREVKDYIERKEKLVEQATLYENAEVTKRLRDGFYYKIPPFLRAHLYFVYRYYFKLGFLDGKPGKIYAFMQAYWYRYLVDAKLYELDIIKKDEKIIHRGIQK